MRISRSGTRPRQKGSIFIEFALCFSLLFVIFTGTFQFGYTFYTYNVLTAAVRDGARYASLRRYDSNSGSPSGAFQLAVQNVVVYGSPSPASGATPVVNGLTTSNVNLSTTFTSVPTSVSVSVNNFDLKAVFFTTRLTGKPIATFPYVGTYSPY